MRDDRATLLYNSSVSRPLFRLLWVVLALQAGCATPRSMQGNLSTLRFSAHPTELCIHNVPSDVCTICHPEWAARFRAAGDWCAEHNLPESQCRVCHPDLSYAPLGAPVGADYAQLSHDGEDVDSLEKHAVVGKFTLFDFYALWCGPCRQLDDHVKTLLQRRSDIAYRRLNINSWDSPLARHYLQQVSNLPYVLVYDKRGQRQIELVGLDLAKLDQAVAGDGPR